MPSSFAWGAALPPLLLLLLLSLGCTPASGTVNKPNVIFMMVDDVGADRFSLYGGDTDVTPNIDSFADKATVFDAFFTQPICGPSRATLISGRYTSRSGVYGNGHKRYEELDESECTLGSVFMNAEYSTGIFGKLHPAHRFLTNLTGICGFEHYVIWAREGPRFINSTVSPLFSFQLLPSPTPACSPASILLLSYSTCLCFDCFVFFVLFHRHRHVHNHHHHNDHLCLCCDPSCLFTVDSLICFFGCLLCCVSSPFVTSDCQHRLKPTLGRVQSTRHLACWMPC